MVSWQVMCVRQDEGPKRSTQKQEVKLKAQLYCWEKLYIGNKHDKTNQNLKREIKTLN